MTDLRTVTPPPISSTARELLAMRFPGEVSPHTTDEYRAYQRITTPPPTSLTADGTKTRIIDALRGATQFGDTFDQAALQRPDRLLGDVGLLLNRMITKSDSPLAAAALINGMLALIDPSEIPYEKIFNFVGGAITYLHESLVNPDLTGNILDRELETQSITHEQWASILYLGRAAREMGDLFIIPGMSSVLEEETNATIGELVKHAEVMIVRRARDHVSEMFEGGEISPLHVNTTTANILLQLLPKTIPNWIANPASNGLVEAILQLARILSDDPEHTQNAKKIISSLPLGHKLLASHGTIRVETIKEALTRLESWAEQRGKKTPYSLEAAVIAAEISLRLFNFSTNSPEIKPEQITAAQLDMNDRFSILHSAIKLEQALKSAEAGLHSDPKGDEDDPQKILLNAHTRQARIVAWVRGATDFLRLSEALEIAKFNGTPPQMANRVELLINSLDDFAGGARNLMPELQYPFLRNNLGERLERATRKLKGTRRSLELANDLI